MTELEERLRNLSIRFSHPDKAYALLSRIRENDLPEVEQQFAALQESVGRKIKTFSVELLTDYLTRGIPLDKKPSLPLLSSNYFRNSLGNGNKMAPKIHPLKERDDQYVKEQ